MKFFICILLIFFSDATFSQKQGKALIDSLQIESSKVENKISSDKFEILKKLGSAYLNISDYTHASTCFFGCLEISQKLNSKRLIAIAYRDIALIFFYQKDLKKAQEYDLMSLHFFKEINDLAEQAASLRSLASVHLELLLSLKDTTENRIKAETYYNEALGLYKKVNDQLGEASILMNQSILCFSNYQKKIELALMAKKIWDTKKSNNNLPTINTGNIGVAFLDLLRFDTLHITKASTLIPASNQEKLVLAEKYLNEAIQMGKSNNDAENSAYFIGVLAELQALKGDYKKAYKNFRTYNDITDSLFSQENKNKIAELESKAEIDAKNQEIENQKLKVREQNKNILFLIFGLIALIFVGVLYYRLSIVRKQKNNALLKLNEELDNANKTKAKIFAILSHDLRSPITNFVNFLYLTQNSSDLLDEDQKRSQEKKITSSAQTLVEVMEGILLWSKGQMENFRPEKTEVAVSSLFSYLQTYFSFVSSVNFHYHNEENLVIYTDENYTRAILQNLTQNAINVLKHVPEGNIVWEAWSENNRINLSITDNGKGLNEELLNKFYENNAVNSSKHGLGLHIITDMAKAINCAISFQKQTNGLISIVITF